MKEPGERPIKTSELAEFKPEKKRKPPEKGKKEVVLEMGREIPEKRIETEPEKKEKIKKVLKEVVKFYPREGRRERVKEKINKIFEAVKEFVGIRGEDLIEYDDFILDDSDEIWRSREEEEKWNREIIGTAAGIKSEKSREFLTKRLGKAEKQKNWKVISAGLMFNDSEWADEIREWLRWDEDVKRVRGGKNGKLTKFSGLNKSEGWFNFRKAMDKVFPSGFYLPGDLLLSEIGVSAENKTKQKLLDEFGKDFPAEAILSFWGDSSPEAQKIVEKYYGGNKRLKWAYDRYQKSVKEKEV